MVEINYKVLEVHQSSSKDTYILRVRVCNNADEELFQAIVSLPSHTDMSTVKLEKRIGGHVVAEYNRRKKLSESAGKLEKSKVESLRGSTFHVDV